MTVRRFDALVLNRCWKRHTLFLPDEYNFYLAMIPVWYISFSDRVSKVTAHTLARRPTIVLSSKQKNDLNQEW